MMPKFWKKSAELDCTQHSAETVGSKEGAKSKASRSRKYRSKEGRSRESKSKEVKSRQSRSKESKSKECRSKESGSRKGKSRRSRSKESLSKDAKSRKSRSKESKGKEGKETQEPSGGEAVKSKVKRPSVIVHSTPVDEDSLDSWGENSFESDEITIIETYENYTYVNRVILGHLSRIGFSRPLWSSKFGSYFVILTFLISYDCLVAFALLFDKYGLLFPMSYVIMMILVGLPLMYMELALGQYTSCNAVTLFLRMCPAFAGLGIVTFLFNAWILVSDQLVITSFFSLFGSSMNIFTNEMPWHTCTSTYNDNLCNNVMKNCEFLNGQLAETFEQMDRKYLVKQGMIYSKMGDICVRSDVYKNKDPIAEHDRKDDFALWFGQQPLGQYAFAHLNLNSMQKYVLPTLEIYVVNFATWLLIICGCLLSRKILLAQAQLGFLMTTSSLACFIAVFAVWSPPDFPFIEALGQPFSLDKMCSWEMWTDTLFLVFRTLKLGQGGLIFLGSQHNFHNNLFNDCLIILLLMNIFPFAYSIIHLLLVDSSLLYQTNGNLQDYHDLALNFSTSHMYSSAHQVVHLNYFVQSFQMFTHYEPFMVFIFALMGILIVLGNKVVRCEIIIDSMMSTFIELHGASSRKDVILLTGFISAISLLTYLGPHGLDTAIGMEHLTYPMIASLVVLLELLVVCVFYGPRRLFSNITFMMSRSQQGAHAKLDQFYNVIVLLLWCFVIPGITVVSTFNKLSSVDMYLQWSMLPFSLLMLASSIVPVVMIVQIWQNRTHWTTLFKPVELWGPRITKDREGAERMERQIRNIC